MDLKLKDAKPSNTAWALKAGDHPEEALMHPRVGEARTPEQRIFVCFLCFCVFFYVFVETRLEKAKPREPHGSFKETNPPRTSWTADKRSLTPREPHGSEDLMDLGRRRTLFQRGPLSTQAWS